MSIISPKQTGSITGSWKSSVIRGQPSAGSVKSEQATAAVVFSSVFDRAVRDRAYTLYEVKSPMQDDPAIQANSWLQEGNLESAFSAYQDSLSRDSSSLPALLGISEVYTRNGEPSLALDSLQQALKVSPENPCVLKALAGGYFNSGELDKAAEGYRQAITAAPWDEKLYRALGDVFLLQDRFDQAKEAYSQSIQVQLDTDPFSFKEIHTAQQTKTGLPASAGANSEGYSQIPSYQDAVAEFFRYRVRQPGNASTTASLRLTADGA
jgi:tetratricopeptide (TPR) repeat protein